MFRIFFTTIFLLLLSIQANAETETQTVWSTAGIYGPLNEWGDNYYLSNDLSTNSTLTLKFGSINLIDPELMNPDEVRTGDIDGDGDIDAVAAGTGCLNWYANNNGAGTNWLEFNIIQDSYEIHDVKIADINDDGFNDLVICTSEANVVWLENTDGTGLEWEEHLITSAPDNLISAEAVDLNKDGYLDVIYSMHSHGIRWMENTNGTGLAWQEHTIQESTLIDNDFIAIDFDLDGFIDIVATYSEGFAIYCYRNLDSTGLNWEQVLISNFTPTSMHFGFINDDAYPDIFGVSNLQFFNGVSWIENPGSITPDWQEHTILEEISSGMCVYGADLNTNGRSDLLLTSMNAVSYFMNISGGYTWQYHVLLSNTASYGITSDDMNQDGLADIIFTKRNEDELVWSDFANYAPSGYLESSVLEVNQQSSWSNINWTANTPDSTIVGVQLRTSDNFPVMGLWTDTIYEPCSLENLLDPEDNYIQYRTILRTTNPAVSPSIQDISLSWETQEGIEEDTSAYRIPLTIQPNPFSSSLFIEFSLNAPSEVSLGLFDLNGRLITELVKDTFSRGSFSLEWQTPTDFPNGCYLMRLNTESGTFTQNCILLR